MVIQMSMKLFILLQISNLSFKEKNSQDLGKWFFVENTIIRQKTQSILSQLLNFSHGVMISIHLLLDFFLKIKVQANVYSSKNRLNIF